MAKQDRHVPCLVQVNTGEEEQKIRDLAKKNKNPRKRLHLLAIASRIMGLNITGLMCIPPADEEPAMHFAFACQTSKNMRIIQAVHGDEW